MTRLAAALLLLLAIAGCGRQTAGSALAGTAIPTTSSPAATSTSVTTTTEKATTTTPRPGGDDVLGPFGWGPVKIGMTPQEAAATGVFTDTPPAGDTCAEWVPPGSTPVESVIISPKIGVAAIIARSGAVIHTPEGVTFGSTAGDVHAAYASFDVADADTPNGPVIPATGNPGAAYRLSFDDSTKLTYLVLESVEQDCYA